MRKIQTLLLANRELYNSVQFSYDKYVGCPINSVRILSDLGYDEIILLNVSRYSSGALDYEFFSEELKGLLEKAHNGATSHSGKVPSKIGGDTKKQMEVLRLKEELDRAVKKEDYEQAAKLRDDIQKIEKGNG